MILSWNKNLLSFPFLSFLFSCLFPLSSSPPSLLLLSPYSRGKRCRTTGSAHGAVIFASSCWFSRSSFFVKISSHWFEEACSSLRIEQRPLSLSLSLSRTHTPLLCALDRRRRRKLAREIDAWQPPRFFFLESSNFFMNYLHAVLSCCHLLFKKKQKRKKSNSILTNSRFLFLHISTKNEIYTYW